MHAPRTLASLRSPVPQLAVALVMAAGVALAPRPADAKLDKELEGRIGEVLREALNSRDALAQGRAIYALSEMGDKSVAGRAKDALQEENWGILQYALRIAATGKRPAKEFEPKMLGALENPRSRPHAFTLLDELPPKVTDSVLKAALDREESLRDEVIRRMADRGDERSLAILAHGLSSKKKETRAAVLGVVPKLRGTAATSFLMKLANGKDEAVRDAALAALLESRDPAVVPFLGKLLKASKDARFRMEVARALAGRGERDAVIEVLKGALDSEDVEVRVKALEGIAALGDRVVAASVRDLATNPREEPRVAVAALAVLGGSGDVANLDTLREALATDHIHLRTGAVRAMGLLTRPEAIPDLARALQDGNQDVRQVAAEALGRVGGAEVVPHLEQAIVPETVPAVRAKIIEALGRSGDPAGVQALQVMLAYKDRPEVVGGAVDAMLEIGDPSAVPVLLLAVDPALPEVMEKAVKAICLLDEAQGMTALDAYLQRFTLDFAHQLNAEAGPRAVVFLERFVVGGTPPQRALALELLLRRGEKGLAVVRTAAKENSDAGIRRTALTALAGRGDKASMDLYTAALGDKDAGILGIGLEAVSRLHEGPVSDDLRGRIEKLMEHRSPSVRVAAAHTLYRLSR